jgi:hypothetical protein
LFGLLATFYVIICDFGAMLWGGPAIKAQMLFCRELAAGRLKISQNGIDTRDFPLNRCNSMGGVHATKHVQSARILWA